MNIKLELLKHELTRVINEELEDFEIDATKIADTTSDNNKCFSQSFAPRPDDIKPKGCSFEHPTFSS